MSRAIRSFFKPVQPKGVVNEFDYYGYKENYIFSFNHTHLYIAAYTYKKVFSGAKGTFSRSLVNIDANSPSAKTLGYR